MHTHGQGHRGGQKTWTQKEKKKTNEKRTMRTAHHVHNTFAVQCSPSQFPSHTHAP